MEENWKSIKDYEGLYEVSNFGRIRSLDRVIKDKKSRRKRKFLGRILQNICASTGYHMVSLHRNNERIERRTVHRLVMETFRPEENMNKLIVDHINGVRKDNRLENLRWVDFDTNNRNTPYVRYLQDLLTKSQIAYISEENWKFN